MGAYDQYLKEIEQQIQSNLQQAISSEGAVLPAISPAYQNLAAEASASGDTSLQDAIDQYSFAIGTISNQDGVFTDGQAATLLDTVTAALNPPPPSVPVTPPSNTSTPPTPPVTTTDTGVPVISSPPSTGTPTDTGTPVTPPSNTPPVSTPSPPSSGGGGGGTSSPPITIVGGGGTGSTLKPPTSTGSTGTITAPVTNATNPTTSTGFDLTGAEGFITQYFTSLWDKIFQWIIDNIITPIKNTLPRLIDWWGGLIGFAYDATTGFIFHPLFKGIKIPSTEAEAIAYEGEITTVLDAPSNIFEWIGSLILRTSLAISAMGARLEPLLELVRQVANSQQPVTPLDVNAAISAQYQGLITQATGEANALKNGISTSDYQTLYSTASYVPSLQDASTWFARGLIAAPDFDIVVSKNHASPEQGQSVYSASYRPVQGASAVANYGRIRVAAVNWLGGTLNYTVPQPVLDFYSAEQINPTQAEYDWMNHYAVPPPEWFAQGVFRGLFASSDVVNAATAYNYPDALTGSFLEMSRPIIPVRVVTTLFVAGVLTEAQARVDFGRSGYSAGDIDTLVAYAKSLSPKKVKTTPADLSKLALNAAIALWEDGILVDAQLSGIYLAHGYSADAASYEIEYLKLKNASSVRKQNAENIVEEVDLGQSTVESGVQQLISAGYSNTEVLRYEKQMHKNKLSKAKVPTSAEIKAMYKAGYLLDTDVLQYYSDAGYSNQWSTLLTALVVGNVAVPVGG